MKLSSDKFTESRFIAEGKVDIKGKTISYKVISEDNVINSDEGKPTGSIFSFSYFRSDVKETSGRPVIFVYNGGPGSSSLWLHMGLFGPRRVKYDDPVNPPTCPPFEVEDNPHCMLDICDIVMIDPVETGYGRLIDGEAESQFCDMESDAYAIALFIEGWLNKYNRWGSPKYLAGESYGTIRSCVLANMLMGGVFAKAKRLNGITVNGIIMLGSAISTGQHIIQENVEPSVINLPTMAAASWYHKRDGKPDLESFVQDAYKFSYNEYLKALFLENYLSKEEQSEIIKKLAYYTGISEDYFKENGLRINMSDFASLVLKDKDLQIGIYDGRYVMKRAKSIGEPDPVEDDPAMGKYTPSFIAVMNEVVKKELNISFDRTYKAINFHINEAWKYDSAKTPIQYLEAALRRNTNMSVFFGSGYYDLCTVIGEVRYVASHISALPEQVIVKEYPSGHMPYLGEESAQMLASDLRAFINKAL